MKLVESSPPPSGPDEKPHELGAGTQEDKDKGPIAWGEKEGGVEEVFSPDKKGIGAKAARGHLAEVLSETVSGWGEKFGELRKHLPSVEIPEVLRKLDKQKILGSKAGTFFGGMASGMAVRYVVKHGLGYFSGGVGYAAAGVGGAIAGATIEGVRAYRKELARIKTQDVTAELRKKSSEIKAEDLPGLKARLDSYLEMVDKEVPPEFSESKQKLFEYLKEELKLDSVRWKNVFGGALVGGVVGAAGGLLGSAMSHLVESYFAPSGLKDAIGTEAKEAAKAAKEAGRSATAEAIKSKIEAAAAEVYAKTHESVVAAGIEVMNGEPFTAVAEEGEGLTHAARKLIHDYIVERKFLGTEIVLEKGQLIYAEDALRRMFEEGAVNTGDVFTAKGEDISYVINEALNLDEQKLANLNKEWVPQVSEKTWQNILDYGSRFNAENNFSVNILSDAKENAVGAMKKTAEESGRALAAPPQPRGVGAAKDAWLKKEWLKYVTPRKVVYTALAGAYVALGILIYKRRKEFGVAARDVGESIREKINARRAKKPRFAVEAEGKKSTTHETEKEKKSVPQEAEEEKKKKAADPFRKLAAEYGIEVKPRDITYRGLVAEDIGKEKARGIKFTNYSDFKSWLDSLTLDQRRKAKNYTGRTLFGKTSRSVGIWGPKELWEAIEKNPEANVKFNEMQKKILKGLLADEYRGVPEKEEVSYDKVFDFIRQIEEEIKEKDSSIYDSLHISSYFGLDDEEAMEGLIKLREILKTFSLKTLRPADTKYTRIRINDENKIEMDPDNNAVILNVDYRLSQEEMRKFLEKATEEMNKKP